MDITSAQVDVVVNSIIAIKTSLVMIGGCLLVITSIMIGKAIARK